MAPGQGWLREADRFTRRLAKWTLDREYRTLEKIRSIPRYTPFTTTDLLGTALQGVDSGSFVNSYAEIFGRQIYRFQTTAATPRVVDCGANIGLSVIYFKRLFPAGLVTAYEADPSICLVLQRNLAAFGFSDVTVHNAAVWNEDTVIEFLTEGADAGRISTNRPEPTARIQRVPTIRLRDHLAGPPIDLLKMDIEGAEVAVLKDCSSSLSHVARVFVEYHSFPDRPQQLHVLLELLADSGFRCYPEPVTLRRQPFLERPSICGMDVQVNVFAFRDELR